MDYDAIRLTLQISLVSTLIGLLFGIPIAWWLSISQKWYKGIISHLIILPMVLPPTVLGYYLLLIFGRNSPIGQLLDSLFGISLVFNWSGAVVAACFVSSPFLIKIVQAGFEGIDQKLIEAARTSGISVAWTFISITLPLSWRYIVAGAVLCLARAMGEFGATLMIAGSIPGKTQTLSLAIYDEVQIGNLSKANALAMTLLLIALGLLMASTIVMRKKRLT